MTVRALHGRCWVLVVLLAVGGASVVEAQPNELFKVLNVNTVGCNSGNFAMVAEGSNLDGLPYFVHTRVQVGSQLYMNELAVISVNGTTGWHVFENFTYGIVPNRGTFPIDDSQPMRIDFSLERPKGIVLSRWTLIVDGCDTGVILYNSGPVLLDGFEVDGTSPWSQTVS